MNLSALLLRQNLRWALSDLLAIERHLQEVASQIDPSTQSWCCRKHSLHLLDHALAEAISHAAALRSPLAAQLAAFRARAEAVLARPDLVSVRALRNDFRRLIGDPTLCASGSVCWADR